MAFNFDGKRALVTGVGKGMGRAIAIALSKAGATVHGISRTQADLDSLKKEEPGINVYNVDLTDWDQTRLIIQNMGPIDLLVNNAGIELVSTFLEAKKEDISRVFSANTYSVYNVSQVVANEMVERGQGGSIVNISSVGSLKGFNILTPYCMSKAAVDMLTKCMAVELGKHQIRVNTVHPTAVITPLLKRQLEILPTLLDGIVSGTPCGRHAELDDIVNATLFLLSDKASMITGSHLPVDGGLLIA